MIIYACKCLAVDLLDKPGGAQSVLAGGRLPGWSPEVAVVLWRRILGCLGNVNNIRDVRIHEEVYEYLCELVNTLVKVEYFCDLVYLCDLVNTLVKVEYFCDLMYLCDLVNTLVKVEYFCDLVYLCDRGNTLVMVEYFCDLVYLECEPCIVSQATWILLFFYAALSSMWFCAESADKW